MTTVSRDCRVELVHLRRIQYLRVKFISHSVRLIYARLFAQNLIKTELGSLRTYIGTEIWIKLPYRVLRLNRNFENFRR